MLTLSEKDCLTRQGFRGPLRRQLDSRRERKEGWKKGDNSGKKHETDEEWSADVREV